jgi:hypothetical protein
MKIRTSGLRTFLAVAGVLAIISLVGGWIGNHYLNVPVSELLSADAYEPCTTPNGESLGEHCFLDYYEGEFADNYPPASKWIFQPFVAIEKVTGSALTALYVWLIASALALLAPLWWATRRQPTLRWPILVLAVASSAFAGPLDRGNSVAFVVPFLLLFAVGTLRALPSLAITGIVGAAILKPQYAVLLIVPIVLGRWREFFRSLIGIGVIQGVGFALGDAGFIEEARQFVRASLNRSTEYAVFDSSNVSFSQTLHDIARLTQGWLGWGTRLTDFEYANRNVIVLFVLLASLAVARVAAHQRRNDLVVIIGLVVASLCVGTTYYYYQCFVLVIAALIIRDPRVVEGGRGILDSAGRTSLSNTLLAVAAASTMFNLPIDSAYFGWYTNEMGVVVEATSVSRSFTVPLWVVAIGAVLAGWRRRSAAVA